MVEKDLGMLKSVNLRKIFNKEETEFTPWLNENIGKLNEILGIEIIDTQTEVPVGKFSLDILGTLANSDKKVIIENQIEPTDHNHLGQLLTYASGVNASIIIWIAKEFTEEHISALEWLNENMKADISFFGIEVKAMKIDDSKPALKFEVIVKPNEWDRILKSVNTISETNSNYLKFFSDLVESYSKSISGWSKKKAQPQSWLNFSAGKAGFYIGWSFGVNLFRVELYIDTGDREVNKSYFDKLMQNKEDIEKEIPSIAWERLDERRACRIMLKKDIGANINNLPQDEKSSLIKWGTENMKTFSEVMTKYIKKL